MDVTMSFVNQVRYQTMEFALLPQQERSHPYLMRYQVIELLAYPVLMECGLLKGPSNVKFVCQDMIAQVLQLVRQLFQLQDATAQQVQQQLPNIT